MDLRDFISMCEMAGQLKGLKTEVNWDLEISHVLRAETRGGKSRPCAALIY
jgi:UbiD family decarboxylase